MSSANPSTDLQDHLVSYFWSTDVLCGRTVSDVILTDTLDIPAPSGRLIADWNREISQQLSLDPGDVDELPLARARRRWPDYRDNIQAVSDWMRGHGLPEIIASSDIALMVCRAARYHHDGENYGDMVFCNLFLSEDKGLDLHFSHTGHRIPLCRGTVVVFDTCQPHAVIDRAASGFRVADFPHDRDCAQVFLSWELPLANANVRDLLGIEIDVDPSKPPLPADGQVWRNGAHAIVCPDSGQWRKTDN